MSQTRRRILNSRHGRWAPAAAFIVVVIFALSALHTVSERGDEKLRQSQIAACQRGNILREELNANIAAGEVRSDALIAFLSIARRARLAAYEHDHQASDREAAVEYGKLIVHVESSPSPRPIELVNCERAVRG